MAEVPMGRRRGGKGAATGQSAVGGPGRGAADRVGVISLGNEFPGA